MRIVDFNSSNFNGFQNGEDLLLDTGIVLAYLNQYDAWHNTVTNLFNTHILSAGVSLYLYVDPNIVNEVTHLSGKPLKSYMTAKGVTFNRAQQRTIALATISALEQLIQHNVVNVIGGNTDSVINQINLYNNSFGAADAANASLANEYGTNFLTLDGNLVSKMDNNKNLISNINAVYFTTSTHISY